MRTLVVIAAFVASLVGCGGPEPAPAVEAQSSALTSGTFRGSYLCGSEWWHVNQTIQWGTTSFLDPVAKVSLPTALATGFYPASNTIDIECWHNPVPLVWDGTTYSNTTAMGNAAECIAYTRRANATWVFSTYVSIPAGNLLLYPGSPNTWEMSVYDAGGGGTHDGFAACGGHFLLFVQ